MYRFRTVEQLIGEYQELEKQQIYFAPRNQLNDPMEGMRRYFWQGDKIVWENFLKHYILCLEHVIHLSRLMPDDKTITIKDIPIFKSEKDLPTDIYRERIKKIYKQFFSNNFVQSYMQFIINNPNKIYFQEMYVHLKVLSTHAINAIYEIDIQTGILPNKGNNLLEREKVELNLALDNIWQDLRPEEYHILIEIIHGQLKSWDVVLLIDYKASPKLQSIHIEFPQMYLDAIVELTYSEAYVACFMDNCINSSIWGTYGNNHTGVCLKYKISNESNPMLALKTIRSLSSAGYSYDFVDFAYKPMNYSADFNELDFFGNLGRLSKSQLIEQWYSNENGELSAVCEKMFSRVDEWRSEYWNAYEQAYLKKLPDWSHENEHRIIIENGIGTYSDKENRLLEYKFESLEAIIFGMKTSIEAKTEIIEIIKRKCEETGRNQFDFFEMEYSNRQNKLYPRKLLSLGE